MAEDLPFDTEGLDFKQIQLLFECLLALEAQFDIETEAAPKFPFEKFDLFNDNPYLSHGGSLMVNHGINKCYLVFVKVKDAYECSVEGADVGMHLFDTFKYQVWGLIISKRNFGRVMIRRETFADRIRGIIHPVELNFEEDGRFNRRYYVVTNDAGKATLAMDVYFRNSVMDIDDEGIIIEMVDNLVVIGSDKNISVDQTLSLTRNMLKLASKC